MIVICITIAALFSFAIFRYISARGNNEEKIEKMLAINNFFDRLSVELLDATEREGGKLYWTFDGYGRYRLYLDKDKKSTYDENKAVLVFSPITWLCYESSGTYYPVTAYEPAGNAIGLPWRIAKALDDAANNITTEENEYLRKRLNTILRIPSTISS